ncbi:MAG: hypothetical protein EZS28_031649 [Streblomastix strix]|uniref:Uncharacterized protein n=1 Tax=Streblomastix strix TaxID=222440 RepID=A0A5J4URL6_9EUKA|nr:MAG: hypothetical protein EZS28_031649 [Streblomastix strix]
MSRPWVTFDICIISWCNTSVPVNNFASSSSKLIRVTESGGILVHIDRSTAKCNFQSSIFTDCGITTTPWTPVIFSTNIAPCIGQKSDDEIFEPLWDRELRNCKIGTGLVVAREETSPLIKGVQIQESERKLVESEERLRIAEFAKGEEERKWIQAELGKHDAEDKARIAEQRMKDAEEQIVLIESKKKEEEQKIAKMDERQRGQKKQAIEARTVDALLRLSSTQPLEWISLSHMYTFIIFTNSPSNETDFFIINRAAISIFNLLNNGARTRPSTAPHPHCQNIIAFGGIQKLFILLSKYPNYDFEISTSLCI